MLEAGWAIDDLVRLDGLVEGRGLISRMLMASSMNRHAILMVLAHRHGDRIQRARDADEGDEGLAKVLRRERAREIVTYALGAPSDGLLGALRRLDGPPLSVRAYVRLRALFMQPENRRKAEALQRVSQPVTEKMLRVLDALDPRWVHAETLARIETYADAIAFNRAVNFAMSVGATEQAIADAIACLQPSSTLARLVERFVRRASADQFPRHPIENDDDDIRRLLTVRDFISEGRAQSNCLAKKIEDALVGRAAYAVFRGSVTLELRPLSGGFGWVLWQVHFPSNKPGPKAIMDAAAAKCSTLGIPHVDLDVGMDRLRQYRRFVAPKHWEWAD